VLLLDEPVEGLDPSTARQVMENVRGLLPATTLIIAMHSKHASVLDWHSSLPSTLSLS
jgi:ABC-type transport system involved in cytochrome bd biosynthesis fused ATPase/permease subunit